MKKQKYFFIEKVRIIFHLEINGKNKSNIANEFIISHVLHLIFPFGKVRIHKVQYNKTRGKK